MFTKNTILLSIIIGVTSLSFIGCGETTDDYNDFSMCDEIGYTNTITNNADLLSGENPVITLQGDRIITVPRGTTNILATGDNYQAYDPQDGDLTSQVKRVNDINPDVAGEYHIKYSIEDSDGNKDIKCRKVIVEGTDSTTNTDSDTIYDNSNYDTGNYSTNTGYDNNNYDTSGGGFDNYIGGEGNSDLGTPVNGDNSTGYNNNYSSNGSDLETFLAWYQNTCGGVFNDSLYNERTKTYKGKIDCSDKGLTSIDLSPLSVFDGIDEIDLSHNKLRDIDFSPIRDIHKLWRLNIGYNTQVLKDKYNTKAKREALFRYFTYLHGGDGKTTGLWIGFKPRATNQKEFQIQF